MNLMLRWCGCVALGLVAVPCAGQSPTVRTTHRLEYRTVRYPQEVVAYRVQRETHYREETHVTYKEQWEEREQVRRYVVQKPVVETADRDENYVVCEPQTTYRTDYEDRGQWEEQQVCQPGVVVNRPVFQPAGYVVDPLTGWLVWQPGGYVLVPTETPAQMVTQRTWKPAIVEVKKPMTTYVEKIVTRKVPVQVTKYVEEMREERTPIRVCKRVPVEEIVRTPYQVERVVPVRETRYVERQEAYWAPVDPCTGETIRERTIERIVPGPISAQKPTEAGSAGESSVLSDGKNGAAKTDAEKATTEKAAAEKAAAEKAGKNGAGGLKSPGLKGNENPADQGHKENETGQTKTGAGDGKTKVDEKPAAGAK